MRCIGLFVVFCAGAVTGVVADAVRRAAQTWNDDDHWC